MLAELYERGKYAISGLANLQTKLEGKRFFQRPLNSKHIYLIISTQEGTPTSRLGDAHVPDKPS